MRLTSGALMALAMLCTNAANADPGSSKREQMLEARIRSLEKRLADIESKLDGQARPRFLKTTQEAVSPSPTTIPSNDVSDGPPKNASETAVVPAASLASGVEAGAVSGIPQETFVFRENSVTLKPRHFEISTQTDYIHANGFLQTDRAVASATSIRLGVFDWLELDATTPAFISTRTRGIGPFRTQSRQVAALGDLLLQGNARLHEQTAETPGIVLSLGALLPTGIQPYNFAFYQPNPTLRGYNPNPTDLNAAYLSRGAWGLVTNLQFYKTVDPIIVFFGVGARYFLPQQVDSHIIQNGAMYTYNMGFSLAVSEKSTLGLQISGAYENRLVIDRHVVPQSEFEPVAVRASLIQRIFTNTWIEPSLGTGLTQDAPSLDIGLGLRHRF